MSRRAGFTLVEVMVALVVLTVGVLALTQLSLSVAVLMNQAGTRTELAALAENRIEEIATTPYDEVTDASDEVSVRGVEYTRRVTVTVTGRALKQVMVEIEPVSGAGPDYSTMTYVSQ